MQTDFEKCAMTDFRHYIITCLNVGVYSHKMWREGDLPPVDEWMEHRLRLFATFTLPSVVGQRCQNFKWLLLMDENTPNHYKDIIENIPFGNLQCVYLSCRGLVNDIIAQAVIENIPDGEYDLLTTEIDSDDAVHQDLVETIQSKYRHRDRIWQISFVQGVIFETAVRQAYLMEYPFHCPTVVENRKNAKSAYHWQNSEIPAESIEYILNTPYWMQVIHSQNVANDMESTASRIIHKDKPISLSALGGFNVDFHAMLALGV